MSIKNLDRGYLSIKEFSKYVGITEPSLRHYDNLGIFKPDKRGIKSEQGYRYYSPTQITSVKMVRVLTEMGVPLETIKELAQNRTPEKLIKLLHQNKDKVASKIRFLQETHLVIDTFTELLNESIAVMETELSVTEMPDRRILLGGLNDFYNEHGFIGELLRFYNGQHAPRVNDSFPIGGYFESMTAFMNNPSQPTRFFSVDPMGNDKRAAGLYLVGYNRGYYGQTNDLPEQMTEYARKNGLEFNGPVYNTYLIDEISEINPNQYLLQVAASVSESRRMLARRPQRQF